MDDKELKVEKIKSKKSLFYYGLSMELNYRIKLIASTINRYLNYIL